MQNINNKLSQIQENRNHFHKTEMFCISKNASKILQVPTLLEMNNQQFSIPQKDQTLLTYFLPFAKEIQKDFRLLEYCFETFLALPVSVKYVENTSKNIASKNIDEWRLDLSSTLSGAITNEQKKVFINLIIKDLTKIPNFLKGGFERTFIEKILIPNFLPPNVDWEIKLIPKETKKLQLSEEARIGFSSFL